MRDSAAAFAAEAERVPGIAWTVPVRALAGDPFPAWQVLGRRESELEIHHVDLATGYRPQDWPDEFVARNLPRVAGSFAGRGDAPACRISAAAGDGEFVIGPAGAEPAVLVTGPAAGLLAWLLGRSAGDGLAVQGAPALPVVPAWR